MRGVHPKVHAAYQANKAALGVSTTALYHTLDRVETGVAAATKMIILERVGL